jgi:transcriptional regulator with XRE-family HTH domain
VQKRYFEKFGRHLKKARVAAKISQAAVARVLRYDQQFVSNWECGISTPPIRIMQRIARLYHCSVDELYELLMEDSLLRTRLQLEDEIRRFAR